MLGAVTPMLNKINTYTKSNSDISGKDIDISIRIEHWGDWIVILEPCLNRVAIGLSNQISITRVLSYCKEYEIIDIGSKRDITNDFFIGFNALKELNISDIQMPKMEQCLNEAVSELLEKGVAITTRVQQSYG